MALACRPQLIVADEPITALDVMTQAQILDLMRSRTDRLELSMTLISHDLSVIAEVCDSVNVMYAGKIVESGPTASIFAPAATGSGPAHPYTARLRHAFPDIRRERTFVEAIPGQPPDLHQPPAGCRFADRCDLVIDECRTREPELAIVRPGHHAACHRSDLVLGGLREHPTASRRYSRSRAEAARSRAASGQLGRASGGAGRAAAGGDGPGGDLPQPPGRRSRRLVRAVDGVSFALGRREILALVGESGCGKTSIVRAIARLEEASAGQILFRGRNIAHARRRALRQLRREIQVVFQDPFESLDPRLTAFDTVEESLLVHRLGGDTRHRHEQVLDAMRQVGLHPAAEIARRYPHQMSGNQRQRLVIAGAMVLRAGAGDR